MYVTNKYLNGTFKSCSKVSVSFTGLLALDLMCGDLDTSRCSPMKWFHFMGDAANNDYVPFQITYIPTDDAIDGYKPMDPYVTPCSHPLNVSILRDCFAIRDAKHSHKLIVFCTAKNFGMQLRRLRGELSCSTGLTTPASTIYP